jgi:hypothetical protein
MTSISVKGQQIVPLPTGSGGNNAVKQQMNDTNAKLTMMMAQANADSKYDPPVPQPLTLQVMKKERFTEYLDMNINIPSFLCITGSIMILYGLLSESKK